MAATQVYRDFERETGYSMDYRECGAVRLALSDASVAELRQIAATAEVTGLPVEFREVDLRGLTVRATRLTYVGELGWELYVPSEMAAAAFERLTEAGQAVKPRLAGYYAIESLRLEKGYRAFGRELGPDTSPVEAGLVFACKLGTAIGFRGREAVERHKTEGVSRRLVSMVAADPAAYAWGGELLLRDGGQADREWIGQGRYQVAIGGELHDMSVSLKPPYDPSGMRIRA